MILPSPAELGRDLRVVHLVTARYGVRVMSFEGHIDVTHGRFRMAVLDPLGRKALTVDWTGTDIAYDAAPWFPDRLRPQNMLADLVLIYWPPEVLRRALAPAHAEFEAAPDHRAVRRDGTESIRADITPGPGGDPDRARVQYPQCRLRLQPRHPGRGMSTVRRAGLFLNACGLVTPLGAHGGDAGGAVRRPRGRAFVA